MPPPAHLFVYGTLRPGDRGALGRDMRARLARESRLVGPATTAGILFDLGRYPGFATATAVADVVHGEVLELADPVHSLAWLDDYEGVGRPPTSADEYQRLPTRVRLAPGPELTASIYVLSHPPQACPRIAGGDWLAHRLGQGKSDVQKD